MRAGMLCCTLLYEVLRTPVPGVYLKVVSIGSLGHHARTPPCLGMIQQASSSDPKGVSRLSAPANVLWILTGLAMRTKRKCVEHLPYICCV